MSRRKRKDRVFVPHMKDSKDPSMLVAFIMICTQVAAPIGLLMVGIKAYNVWKRKKNVDYRNYATIIGNRCEVDISEFSAKLGKVPSLVISDLQKMIEKGYLGSDAYIDRSRNLLILDVVEAEFTDDSAEYIEVEVEETPKSKVKIKFDAKARSAEAPKATAAPRHAAKPRPIIEIMPEVKPEPQTEVKPEAKTEPKAEAQPSPEDQFEVHLRRIRRLNDDIADEAVSARIDRIGELTASIFYVVREKPDHRDEVRKFMNYYLPTTFKLLESYALMEKQSYQGENIIASRRKIEEILDTLITAFEHQQDRLFRTEAMDVDADIQVLETMMASDGLITPKGSDLRAAMRKK